MKGFILRLEWASSAVMIRICSNLDIFCGLKAYNFLLMLGDYNISLIASTISLYSLFNEEA